MTLAVAQSPTREESWSDNSGPCALNATTRKVTWRLKIDDDCNISEYFKKTVTIVPEPVVTVPTNGVAQCTKTPCNATEKISVDCATAFGAKLSDIEK